jgi:hypothetical protein
VTDLNTVIAVVSLLHELADVHSGTRLFRGRPVLDWTLKRLCQARSVDVVAIHCWADQVEAVTRAVGGLPAGVIDRGPRRPTPAMQGITAARAWADGWRGGLLGSCDFDLGFHAGWVAELIHLHDADAVLLIDPAAALVDPALIDSIVEHAESDGVQELYFTQAAPGLAATLLRRELVDRLALAGVHPGRLLTYFPDQHGVDPVGKAGCVPVPTPVARTTDRFKLDSDRQVKRFDTAYAHLNGHLASTDAEGLVSARSGRQDDSGPRDVTVEITTKRNTTPCYMPRSMGVPPVPGDVGHGRDARATDADRADLSIEDAKTLFTQLTAGDVRVTFAGVGDPLARPDWADFVQAARDAGVRSIHIETDLVRLSDEDARRLIDLGVDVVTVHLPAANSNTYRDIMGGDHFSAVIDNVTRLENAIAAAGSGTPLIAMTFTKMAANLGEMELWYDYWIRRHGHAVIAGPSDFAGQIPALAVADMAPPRRRACARLSSALTVLSDGKFVACTQDFAGVAPMGESVKAAWTANGKLRRSHESGEFTAHPLCASCKEWHRR